MSSYLIAESTSRNYDCNRDQGIKFNTSREDTFGFLKSATISGVGIEGNWPLENPQAEAAVAAVLESVRWTGEKTDPIEIVAWFNLAGKNFMKKALKEKERSITFNFEVYEYDPEKKAHFLAFAPSADLTGNVSLESVNQNGESKLKRVLHIDSDFDPNFTSEKIFRGFFQAAPDKKQEMKYNLNESDKYIEVWGVGA